MVVKLGPSHWEGRRLRVFENRALRRIFGRKMDEVTGEWRKLHNEELNDLYSSTSIVQVIRSRRMSVAGHVTHMWDVRGVYKVLVGKSEGRKQLGRIILRWIFRKWDVGACTGSIWLRIGTGGGHL